MKLIPLNLKLDTKQKKKIFYTSFALTGGVAGYLYEPKEAMSKEILLCTKGAPEKAAEKSRHIPKGCSCGSNIIWKPGEGEYIDKKVKEFLASVKKEQILRQLKKSGRGLLGMCVGIAAAFCLVKTVFNGKTHK